MSPKALLTILSVTSSLNSFDTPPLILSPLCFPNTDVPLSRLGEKTLVAGGGEGWKEAWAPRGEGFRAQYCTVHRRRLNGWWVPRERALWIDEHFPYTTYTRLNAGKLDFSPLPTVVIWTNMLLISACTSMGLDNSIRESTGNAKYWRPAECSFYLITVYFAVWTSFLL